MLVLFVTTWPHSIMHGRDGVTMTVQSTAASLQGELAGRMVSPCSRLSLLTMAALLTTAAAHVGNFTAGPCVDDSSRKYCLPNEPPFKIFLQMTRCSGTAGGWTRP